jgi:hypothetical protein
MALRELVPANRLVPAALAIALAGCGSFGAIGLPWQKSQTPPPADPAMLPPVQSSNLPPPPGAMQAPPQQQAGQIPGTDSEGAPLNQPQTALNAPATGTTGTAELGRTDLLGGWTITSGGDSCQLFMTLTSWTGGYRASTRGCSNDILKSISAWNLQGKQVVLAGQGGTPVARLASSGNNRFDGQTEGQGTSVSFYR